MASVGLLEKTPNPTPEQIRKGLDGNICRCGTFSRIFEAVSSVSARGQRASAPTSLDRSPSLEGIVKGVQRG
jgi:xanthine dehydrogenase iron-sulfur cluster and FAD-binding subunit A